MTAPCHGHNEYPSLTHFAGTGIDDERTCTEVHLRRIAWLELHHGRDLARLSSDDAFNITVYRPVTAGEAVVIDQGRMDSAALHTVLNPLIDLIGKR